MPKIRCQIDVKERQKLMHILLGSFFSTSSPELPMEERKRVRCLKRGKATANAYFPIGRPSGMLYVPTLVQLRLTTCGQV